MTAQSLASGTAHQLPSDLKRALHSNAKALAAWQGITPLARNEWICWTVSVALPATRADHVRRVVSELKDGMRRPCCWSGCPHRKDKALSPSQEFVLKTKRR